MMKLWKQCVWLVFLFVAVPQIAYANSSWHWLTARPWDLLPIAILVTIISETYIISKYGEVASIYRVFTAVWIANFVSFFVPYIRRTYYSWYFFHRGTTNFVNDISSGFKHAIFQPNYTVELYYLALTIILEVPLVYLLLRRKSSNGKRLLLVIIAANIITTVITFLLEKMFCHGKW